MNAESIVRWLTAVGVPAEVVSVGAEADNAWCLLRDEQPDAEGVTGWEVFDMGPRAPRQRANEPSPPATVRVEANEGKDKQSPRHRGPAPAGWPPCPFGPVRRSSLLETSVLIEHFTAATAALDGRARGGRRYDRTRAVLQCEAARPTGLA